MSAMVMKVSYHIDAPVEAVYEYFKDPASDSGLGMEVLEAKKTKEGVGTYMSWRMKVAGVPVWQGLEVITDVQPNKHITEKSSSAMVGTWEYGFEPEGAGTRITMEHRPRSLWAVPPLANVVDAATTRLSRAYIGRAKQNLEARPATARKRQTVTKPRKTASAR
jgi:hypothetical protein